MRLKPILSSVSALGLILPIAPALAQSAPGADENEIIVTARKREESILRVPVVAAVLGEQQLQNVAVTDLNDIASQTTGVVLGLASLESGTQISIRGVGTTAADPGIDHSVTLNLDGLQVTQGSAYTVGVFDMQQIEILKGPQALFFGKASTAGVISIRTNDPGDELEVIGRTGFEAEADEWRSEAVISAPLSDTFGLRLAGLYSDSAGFFRNTAEPVPETGAVRPARRHGKSTAFFLRGTALFTPSSNFTARLKVNYTRDRYAGSVPYQLVGCPEGLFNYTGFQFFNPTDQCKMDRKMNIVDMNPAFYGGSLRNGGRSFSRIEQKFGSLELNYNLSPQLTVTSVTGLYKISVDAMMNGTATASAASTLAADKSLNRREFTQEVRLNSDFGGPLDFTAGGFYQDGKLANDILINGNTYFSLPAILQAGSHEINIETISFFGQARFKPVEQLEISAGARWTHEKRDDDALTRIGGVFTPVALPKLSSKNWAPELTITYTPTDDLTIFGSLKQGYKSGSYNISVPVSPGQTISFNDEKVRGGEIGLKSRLADRQLNINLAGYYYEYKGLQVGAFATSTTGLPVLRTQNAGAARVYGVDFDATFRPRSVPGLALRGAVNWNHARFTDFKTAPCWGGQTIAEGCNLVPAPITGATAAAQIAAGYFAYVDPATNQYFRYAAQDLSGTALPKAPNWQATLGIDYEMPAGKDMTLRFGTSGQYSSSYLSMLSRRPEVRMAKAAKINANIALVGPDESFEVALIGNNLTNILRSGTCSTLNFAGSQTIFGAISGAPIKGPSGSDEVHCIVDRGREVWIRLTLRPSSIFGN